MSNGDEVPGELIDESLRFSLPELCDCCGLELDDVVELVAFGIVEPLEGGGRSSWHFGAGALQRLQRAQRLQRDLELELPGLSLALDLLDEIDRLRTQLRMRR